MSAMQPTYFVRDIGGDYHEAAPQPVLAAPDLLKELRRAREFIDGVHDGEYGYFECTRDELVEQIDAAIAAASV